jgi:Carboxypeptidase regulatory-like domain
MKTSNYPQSEQMCRFRRTWIGLSVILFLIVLTLNANAQTDTGRIRGSVEDVTGGVIPGATITVKNVDQGASITAVSDGTGNFTVSALPRGNYSVGVAADGFGGQTQSVTLEVSQVQEIGFKLNPSSVSTEVVVTDAAPIVDTSTSSVGEVIQGPQVTQLPLNGRNFTTLALLAPGVTRGQYGSSASGVNGDAETFRNQESGGGAVSSNGLRQQANNYLLDGIDNNEALVNTLVFFPNVDATQEFRVNTSIAPAEFGRAGGAIVQTSIKSGTNQIHGSAFEFARSSVFDANPNYQFFGASHQPALPFKRNEFGGSVGLPIIKDKLFLFGDYQGYRENTPLNPQFVTVPTALMRTGDFSELTTWAAANPGQSTTNNPTCAGNSPNVGAIYDPITCTPFSGNMIPQNRQNPAAVKYLNAYPLPNVPGTINGTEDNYRTIRQQNTHYNTFDVRVDANIGARDQLFARFAYDQSDFTRTSEFAALPAGFASGSNTAHARGIVVGETHALSSNLLNEFRLGYNRYTFTNAPVFSNQPISADLGIVNANRSPQMGGGALIGGFQNQLEYTGDYGLYAVPENMYEIIDAFTINHGHHSFKVGGNATRRDVSYFRPIAGKGYFQIGNGEFTGYEVSELLAGFVDNYSIGAQTGFLGTRNYEWGIYGEDDWKFSHRLTLNLGLRYDVITYPSEEHNRQAALNPITGTIDLAGVSGVPRSIIDTDFGNVAPRVGFSYDLFGNGKSVLRGGYGIVYFLDRGGIDNQYGQQVPFGGSVEYTAANGYRITFTGQGPLNNNNNSLATNALPLPGYPNFDPAHPPAGVNIFTTNRHNQIPMVQQYNLQFEQQIAPKTLFSIAYVGNKTDHLATGYNYNTIKLDGTPQLFPNLGQVVAEFNNGTSHYNSLQTSVQQRAADGLTLTGSYTWAHNIDNSDGYLGYFAVSPLYVFDTRINKGNSTLDQRHVFVASALYELPFGHGKHFGSNWGRKLDTVAGGWQVNTIVQAETGTPVTVTYPQYGGNVSIRASHNGPLVLPHSISGFWFDPSGFYKPDVGTDGNLGRNAIYGPGLGTGDVSVFKYLSLTERVKTELRAEAFNVTNTPQFTNPASNVGDGNFGRISATRQYSERQLQMAVRFTF